MNTSSHNEKLKNILKGITPTGIVCLIVLIYSIVKTIVSPPFFGGWIIVTITSPIVITNVMLLLAFFKKYKTILFLLLGMSFIFLACAFIVKSYASYFDSIKHYFDDNTGFSIIFLLLYCDFYFITFIVLSSCTFIALAILFFVFKIKKRLIPIVSFLMTTALSIVAFFISFHVSNLKYKEFRTFSYEKWNSGSLDEKSPRRRAVLENLLNRYDLLSFNEEMVNEYIGVPDAIENRLEYDFAVDKNIELNENYKYTYSFIVRDRSWDDSTYWRLLCIDIDNDSKVTTYYTWAGIYNG